MKITPELVRKYLSGECTPEEKAAVDEWYQSFDDHPDPLRFLDAAEQERLKSSMFDGFRAQREQNNGKGPGYRTLYLIAGALTGLAAMLLLFLKVGTPANEDKFSGSDVVSQFTIRNNSLAIYKKILPDKSVVWLAPKSTITYPDRFKGAQRDVKLTGEAFFEVTKDQAHPFVITSREIVTKVWGTSFRVRALADQPAEVSVVTGKVSVHRDHHNDEVLLLPDQKVTLIGHEKLIKKTFPVAASEMRIWKKVSLAFNDTRMEDVFKALNQKFDTHIYSNDARLNGLSFTADLTDQSLPAILDMIDTSINASYAMKDSKTFVFTTNTL